MKRGDAYFATVGNTFCCSVHFLSTEVSLSRAKRLQARCEAASESAKAEASIHRNKEFSRSNVGCRRKLQLIDELWLFLTRLKLGPFERYLAFRFNI